MVSGFTGVKPNAYLSCYFVFSVEEFIRRVNRDPLGKALGKALALACSILVYRRLSSLAFMGFLTIVYRFGLIFFRS